MYPDMRRSATSPCRSSSRLPTGSVKIASASSAKAVATPGGDANTWVRTTSMAMRARSLRVLDKFVGLGQVRGTGGPVDERLDQPELDEHLRAHVRRRRFVEGTAQQHDCGVRGSPGHGRACGARSAPRTVAALPR